MRSNRQELARAGSRLGIVTAISLLTVAAAVVLAIVPAPALSKAGRSANGSQTASDGPKFQKVVSAYGRLPLIFEANQGQTDSQVKFLARGAGYSLFLTGDEAVLALARAGSVRRSVVRMTVDGARHEAEVEGADELPGKSNYFIGNDSAGWHRDVAQFARVGYRQVYPGIDLTYYGNQGSVEYDFAVSPGADAQQVGLRFEGAKTLAINADGNLDLGLADGTLQLKAPRIYQRYGDEQRAVAGRFKLRAQNTVGFEVGDYDHRRTLIIDPVLTYSTYLGGSGEESCSAILNQTIPTYPGTPGCPAIFVTPGGNAYVAGSTTSPDFPGITANSYQQTLASGATANIFIAEFQPGGGSLVFATYLGGDVLDYTSGIGVDGAGNVLVGGTTSSTNFPTTSTAFQTTPLSSGKNHVFVSKLDPTGHSLLYSTYLSGDGVDLASGLAVDPAGKAYVTGTTQSNETTTGFPSTVGAFQTAPATGSTIQFFMTKVDPGLSGKASVVYSTYFGGGNSVRSSGPAAVGGGIAVDVNSNVYISGGTSFLHLGQANDFPLLNAYQGCLDSPPGTTTCPANVSAYDVFAAKFDLAQPVGAQLQYSTYLGGSGDDIAYGVAVDPGVSGSNTISAYLTGSTTSNDWTVPAGITPFQGCLDDPANQPPNCTPGTNPDAFVAKLGVPCVGSNCTTSAVPFSYFSYLGGSGTDIGLGIAIDLLQGARLTGWTDSTDFPVVHNPVQSTFGGGASDAFVARIDTTATTNDSLGHSSSYLGGGGTDAGTGAAVDYQGAVYVAGETSSSPFPTKNPYQANLNGSSDAFVTKLGPVLSMSLTATGNPSPVGVGNQVSFVYTITNNGDFTNGVAFTDFLPSSGATFVSATANPGTCGTPSGGTVLCNIGSLNAGATTATVTVIVVPTVPAIPGTVTMLSNQGSVSVFGATLANAGATVTVNDFTVSIAPATDTVPAGVPATYTATITPTGVIPSSISIACGAGLPTGATCLPGNNNPIPSLLNGAQSAQLIINTTARVTTTTRLWNLGKPFYAAWLPLSGLAFLGMGIGPKTSRRRRILMGLLLAAFLASALFQVGCSGKSSTTTTTGTPAGNYTVTVNATSGTNAVRTTTVTLVVQ